MTTGNFQKAMSICRATLLLIAGSGASSKASRRDWWTIGSLLLDCAHALLLLPWARTYWARSLSGQPGEKEPLRPPRGALGGGVSPDLYVVHCLCFWGRQDPLGKPFHNNGKAQLMGLIRNMHIVFDYVLKRWFTPKELLLAQVFPVPGVGLGEERGRPLLCSFGRERPDDMPPRLRNAVIHQVGNSMNVHAIGVSLIWLFENVSFSTVHGANGSAHKSRDLRSFVKSARSYF